MAESSTSGHLEKDMIDDARLWRMTLRIDRKNIDVALTSTVSDNSLIYRTITLDESAESWQAAIEDAVYANPLLLSDFSSIDIAIDADRFTIIPGEVNDRNLHNRITAHLFADSCNDNEPTVTVADRIGDTGATLLMMLPEGVDNFLRRTFFNARMRHCVSVLAQYFHSRDLMGNAGKMFVHLHPGSVTIVAFGHNGLAMANRLASDNAADTVYYILAARHELNHDADDSQLLISGNAALRDAIVPTLREYAPYVMPLFFPASLLKAGHEAINAPLELSVMQLCE